MCKHFKAFFLVTIFLSTLIFGQVANYSPPELQKINITEHSGEQIPLDLEFTNDLGDTVKLAKYFNQGKPVILILAYYNCPMLCSLVLNGTSEVAQVVSLNPGEDYTILTISIDPSETYQLAAAKKKNYVASLGEKANADGWIFFTSREDQVMQLADALGFEYYYDKEKEQEQYAHPAVLHVLTEKGIISRYLYGIQFKPNDYKISLLEASQGKIGNSLDKILLYCFHYDPESKGYVVMASNVMRLGGVATVIILGLFLGLLWTNKRLGKEKIYRC